MSNWQTRLGRELVMWSPAGNLFRAKWSGNTREIEKMIGEFSFPAGRAGSVIQDLGSRAARYPITFYFDGPQNDLVSSLFFEACKQRGPWDIEHPLYGPIELQLIRVTTVDHPIESGNVTEIQSEWIEPLDEVTLETARQLWGVIDQLQRDLDLAAASAFAEEPA